MIYTDLNLNSDLLFILYILYCIRTSIICIRISINLTKKISGGIFPRKFLTGLLLRFYRTGIKPGIFLGLNLWLN